MEWDTAHTILRMMTDPAAYRVILRARNKPGSGFTYVITRLDDPLWSQGTNNYYPSPEAASEAGRVALESLLARQAGRQADNATRGIPGPEPEG